MKTVLTLIPALLFAAPALAMQLSFTETITGGVVGSGAPAAAAAHDEACAAWKARAREIAGNALLYNSCGTRQQVAPRTFHEKLELDPNSNTSSYVTEYLPPFGNEAYSVAKLVVDVSGDTDSFEEKLESTGASCDPQNSGECLAARRQADANYARDCRAFQENARQNLGARLIYASCGEREEAYLYPLTTQNRFAFAWKSTGHIFYRR